MTTVADAVAEALQRAGVSIVFGLPGGEVVALLDAFRRRDIRFVLVRNEGSAAFMADTFARIMHTPGVCLSTLGPGAANAMVGIAHAHLDRCPVLLLAGQMPAHLHAHHTHQTLDLPALFAPITKGTFALRPQGVEASLQSALALLAHGRPGPVHLQVDKETATAAAEPGPSLLPRLDIAAASATPADIAKASIRLQQAQRPVILAGLGLEPDAPYDALRALAEVAHVPVLTTPKAKGALAEDHPLHAGTLGLTHSDPVYEILDEADCVVAVGFDVVEVVKPWTRSPPLIWVSNWANEGPCIASEVDLVGPLQPTLQALTAALGAETNQHAATGAWGSARVQAFRDRLQAAVLPAARAGTLLPQQVLQLAHEQLPREASVSVDVGSHKILASLSWPSLAPNRFFVSNGLSSMGFGLPAAMAAALARPTEPSICFTGDAGLAMVAGELGVLRELDLPVIVVVFNDAAIDLIRSHQVRQGYPVFGTEFRSVDHVALAKAHGIEAERVSDVASYASAFSRALSSRGPRLLDVMIDPVSYPTTPR